MTIAVTTPAGNVGSHVVRMLCQAGVRPRLLLRNPGRLGAGVRDQSVLAVGDQRDAGYVAEATRGAGAVFWVRPDDWSLPGPDADAERTGEGLAAAMRQNRIARVVFLGSIGAGKRPGAGFVGGLARIEQRLDAAREQSGTALLHLRCGYFMTNLLADLDGLRAGRLITIRPLDDRCRGPARATSPPWPRCACSPATGRAAWCRRCTDRPTRPGPRPPRRCPAATGVPVTAQQNTGGERRAALRDAGMAEVAVEGVVGMSTGKREGFTAEQPRTMLTTTPGSLAGWAITRLRPALQPHGRAACDFPR